MRREKKVKDNGALHLETGNWLPFVVINKMIIIHFLSGRMNMFHFNTNVVLNDGGNDLKQNEAHSACTESTHN